MKSLFPYLVLIALFVAGTRLVNRQQSYIRSLQESDSVQDRRDSANVYVRAIVHNSIQSSVKTMKLIYFFALLIMLSSQTLSAQDGNWRIEQAQLPDGKPYNGSLTISRVGKSYGVDWKTTAGNYSGLGLLADGKLFVGYGLSSGYGIVVYKTNKATQRIEGIWTASGLDGATGTETLTGRDGNYDLVGTNPDGRPYRGKLTLQKTGDTFQAQWQVGNGVYNGVGFISGDYLVIGYGPDQAFGTVEYVLAGNKARGRWAMGGGSQFGTENITR